MEVNYTDINFCRLAWRAIKNMGYISGAKAYFDSNNEYTGFVIAIGDDPDDRKYHKLMNTIEKIGLDFDHICICASLYGCGIIELR